MPSPSSPWQLRHPGGHCHGNQWPTEADLPVERVLDSQQTNRKRVCACTYTYSVNIFTKNKKIMFNCKVNVVNVVNVIIAC